MTMQIPRSGYRARTRRAGGGFDWRRLTTLLVFGIVNGTRAGLTVLSRAPRESQHITVDRKGVRAKWCPVSKEEAGLKPAWDVGSGLRPISGRTADVEDAKRRLRQVVTGHKKRVRDMGGLSRYRQGTVQIDTAVAVCEIGVGRVL